MIGYLLDSHFGPYDQAAPSADLVRSRLADLTEEARRADRAGFGGIFVPDRHARTECVVSSPLLYLASLAGEVSRARLGVYSLVLSAHHPMVVAEEAAMVDLLTNGRLTLSVSIGYHPRYWAQFGLAPKQRLSRFEEGLEILRAAWAGESFSHHGKRFDLEGRTACPNRPLQEALRCGSAGSLHSNSCAPPDTPMAGARASGHWTGTSGSAR